RTALRAARGTANDPDRCDAWRTSRGARSTRNRTGGRAGERRDRMTLLSKPRERQPPPLSETPSTKPQAPEKFQISKQQTPKTGAAANGAQITFGAWSLEFGACRQGSASQKL